MAASAIKRVAIVGAESTGKTWLAENLAKHFGCMWVPEYSRDYLSDVKRAYTKADVEAIALGQLEWEDKLAKESALGSYLFCDTDMLVIKIWMDHAYGSTPQWVLDEIGQRQYYLHLLTDHDIPYEPDPLREHPEMRDYFTGKYVEALDAFNLPYHIIKGDQPTRLQQCLNLLQ